MNRKAKIYYCDFFAGILSENDDGFTFEYDDNYYINNKDPISLTLPLSKKIFKSNILFSFFDGLIPEGYLYEIAIRKFKLSENDRFGVLLKVCKDTIGAVSIEEIL